VPARLRVVVVGEFAPDRFGLHIAETLAEMGHDVTTFQMRNRPMADGAVRRGVQKVRDVLESTVLERLPAARRRRAERLAGAATGADLVLLTYDYLLPAEVALVRARSGARLVLWYPDAIINMGRMAFLAAPYEALFFKDPYLVHTLRELSVGPVYYLPEAFNPHRHRLPPGPVDRSDYACDITTAGTLHAPRLGVFRQLTDYDVRIWGDPAPWWLDAGPVGRMHQGRHVVNQEKAVAFTSASVVLNTLHPSEVWGVNARAFEAAGIGAFQMIDWRPGLDQLFEEGGEIVSFRGVPDLRERLTHYLGRPDLRLEIAERGRVRAAAEHTFGLRLNVLLESVFGSTQGYPLPPFAQTGLAVQ
jgi:spore maturation protein CgeB